MDAHGAERRAREPPESCPAPDLQPGKQPLAAVGLCGDAPAEGLLLALSFRRWPAARHGIFSTDLAGRPRDLAWRGHFETTVSFA